MDTSKSEEDGMLFSSETVSLQHEAECFVLLPILEENVEVILAGNDLVDDTELSDGDCEEALLSSVTISYSSSCVLNAVTSISTERDSVEIIIGTSQSQAFTEDTTSQIVDNSNHGVTVSEIELKLSYCILFLLSVLRNQSLNYCNDKSDINGSQVDFFHMKNLSNFGNSDEFSSNCECSQDHDYITEEYSLETLDDCTSVNESQLLQDLNNDYLINESQYLQDLNNGYLGDTNGLFSMNSEEYSLESSDDCTSVNESQLLQDLNNNSINASQYLQDLNNGYLGDINHLSSISGFQPSETLNNLNEHSEYVNDITTVSQLESHDLGPITCWSEPLNVAEYEVDNESPGNNIFTHENLKCSSPPNTFKVIEETIDKLSYSDNNNCTTLSPSRPTSAEKQCMDSSMLPEKLNNYQCEDICVPSETRIDKQHLSPTILPCKESVISGGNNGISQLLKLTSPNDHTFSCVVTIENCLDDDDNMKSNFHVNNFDNFLNNDDNLDEDDNCLDHDSFDNEFPTNCLVTSDVNLDHGTLELIVHDRLVFEDDHCIFHLCVLSNSEDFSGDHVSSTAGTPFLSETVSSPLEQECFVLIPVEEDNDELVVTDEADYCSAEINTGTLHTESQDKGQLNQALPVINLWGSDCLCAQHGADLCIQNQNEAFSWEVGCSCEQCKVDVHDQERSETSTILTSLLSDALILLTNLQNKEAHIVINDTARPGLVTTLTMLCNRALNEVFQTVLQTVYSNQLQCCVIMTVHSCLPMDIEVLVIAVLCHNEDYSVLDFCVCISVLATNTDYSDEVLYDPLYCTQMAIVMFQFYCRVWYVGHCDIISSNCCKASLLVPLNVMYCVSTTCQPEEVLLSNISKLSNSSFVSNQPSECIGSQSEHLCLLPVSIQCTTSSLYTTPVDSANCDEYNPMVQYDDDEFQSCPDCKNNGSPCFLLESVTPETECSQQEFLIVYPTTIGCHSDHTIAFPMQGHMQGHCSGHPSNDYQIQNVGIPEGYESSVSSSSSQTLEEILYVNNIHSHFYDNPVMFTSLLGEDCKT